MPAHGGAQTHMEEKNEEAPSKAISIEVSVRISNLGA